jgi:hypothetical protein
MSQSKNARDKLSPFHYHRGLVDKNVGNTTIEGKKVMQVLSCLPSPMPLNWSPVLGLGDMKVALPPEVEVQSWRRDILTIVLENSFLQRACAELSDVHCSQHRGNFSFRLMLKGWRSGSASGRP